MYLVKSSQAASLLPMLFDRFGPQSSILLDIDEDFYGVMKGSVPLSGINFRHIISLNDLLADTFNVIDIHGRLSINHDLVEPSN